MTDPIMTLIMPLPVPVNKAYLHSLGRVILSPEARAYKNRAQWEALAQYREAPLRGELSVVIHFYARKGDIDGRIKLLLDSLNGIAWGDDRQILQLQVWQHLDPREPRAEVEVRRFAGYPLNGVAS